MQKQEMNSFLQNCAHLYLSNPNLSIEPDTIYDKIRCYGLRPDEFRQSISDQIETLEANFKSAKRLIVYTHPGMKTYLQFHSQGASGIGYAKLYVSVPKEYIGYVAERIFRFIDKKKITSCSKVHKSVSSDVIVLRIPYNEVKRVTDFINDDKSISGLIRYGSPFMYRRDKVGMAFDDELSYNLVVSGFIATYLNDLKARNSLGSASLESFISFYNKYYQDVFVNGSRLREYTGTRTFTKLRDQSDSTAEYVNNHAQVANLFLLFLNNQLDYDKYIQFVKNCNDSQIVTREIERYIGLLKQPLQQHNTARENAQKLLNEYINYSATKNETPDIIAERLVNYLSGNDLYITRDKNFRARFGFINKRVLVEVMQNNPKNYIENFLHRTVENNAEYATNKYELFNAAMIATARKYGPEHLAITIQKMLTGDFGSITNDSNYRLMLFKDKQNYNPDNVMYFCKLYLYEKGYNLNMVDDIIGTYAMHIGSEYIDKQK